MVTRWAWIGVADVVTERALIVAVGVVTRWAWIGAVDVVTERAWGKHGDTASMVKFLFLYWKGGAILIY